MKRREFILLCAENLFQNSNFKNLRVKSHKFKDHLY
jgi:hypothetical protein